MRSLRLTIVALSTFILLYDSSVSQGSTTVMSVERNSLILDHRMGRYTLDTIAVNGGTLHTFRDLEYSSAETGTITLPSESFLVALPSNATPTVEILSAVPHDLGHLRLAPVPRLSFSDDSLHTLIQEFSEIGPYASGVQKLEARVTGIFQWRGYTIARIAVNAFTYDAAAGILTGYSSIRIKVSFATNPSPSFAASDPRFDDLFRSLVVNADQARNWRRGTYEGTSSSSVIDSTQVWFDPSNEYVRIAVREDGLYSLSFEEIAAALNLAGPLLNHGLALFHKGTRSPVIVTGAPDGECNPGDSVVFYARSPEKEAYSDTSVYWLSVSEDSAAGAPVDSVINPSAVDTLKAFRHQIFLEKDNIYFFGNGGLPVNNTTGEAQGEGWYWQRLFANQSTSFSFLLQNPDTSSVPFRLTGRFNSPVQNQAEPTHNLQIRVNGALVGTVIFNQNRDTVFQMDFPPSFVFPGVNTVSIQSVPTVASLNEVYFDWMKVEVQETLTAVSDTLLFEPDPVLAGSVVLFPIEEFTSPQVTVVRLGPDGDIEKIFSGSVTGSGPFTYAFSDTVLSGRRYYAAGAGRYLAAPSF
ncbi:MAG TPA: hypothetical protein VGA55_03095, partial [Bacteroidota bacterium]